MDGREPGYKTVSELALFGFMSVDKDMSQKFNFLFSWLDILIVWSHVYPDTGLLGGVLCYKCCVRALAPQAGGQLLVSICGCVVFGCFLASDFLAD